MIGNPQTGEHRWSCAEAEVPCDHAEKGCPALIKRSDLKQHLTSCLFEQMTPYMNTIKEEIEELKKDREKKTKQIDALLRAQARLNGQLADLRPLSAFTAAAGRGADPRPSTAGLASDARMARAAEVVRQRREARLNAQSISDDIPQRSPNIVSGTPQTAAQIDATPLVPRVEPFTAPEVFHAHDLEPLLARIRRTAFLAGVAHGAEETISHIPELPPNIVSGTPQTAAQIDATPLVPRMEPFTAPEVFHAHDWGPLLARIRRTAFLAGVAHGPEANISHVPGEPSMSAEIRGDNVGTLTTSITSGEETLATNHPEPSAAPGMTLATPRDSDSQIQPPSTASMPSSSEVFETMATQGSTTSSSLPVNTSGVGTSNSSDLVTTTDSMSGGTSHQSTDEIALTGTVARLDTSVSSSIVPGDRISNFRLPASADNRVGAITSHGLDGPSRLSEARRIDVETLVATSLNLARDILVTNYPIAVDAPGTTRATAIEIDSDPEDDLDSILDMPMFQPEAFGDMHRAVSHLLERANRMERVLEA